MSTTTEELKSPFEGDSMAVLIGQRSYEVIWELHATRAMGKDQKYDRNKKQMHIGRAIAGDLRDAYKKCRGRRYATGEYWR